MNLGTLGGFLSSAYDVNRAGDVVGYSYDNLGRSRAFLWLGGHMYDLNDLMAPGSGWILEAAYGINDAGQIVGAGDWNGLKTAFQLDASQMQPAPPSSAIHPSSAVPEPASWQLALIGACAPGGAVLRRIRH